MQATTIIFSHHAAQRLQERVGTTVRSGVRVRMPASFRLATSYAHKNTGKPVNVWHNGSKTAPVALIVDQDSSVVLTVYIGSELSGRNSPFMAKIGACQ